MFLRWMDGLEQIDELKYSVVNQYCDFRDITVKDVDVGRFFVFVYIVILNVSN